MKFNINQKDPIQIQNFAIYVFFVGSILLTFQCSSKNKEVVPLDTIETTSTIPKELRLTYHAVWVPKIQFEMIHSGSLFGTGNTYTISYQQLTEKITLKLSSTDRENQSQFPYLVKQPIGKEQVFYFPWKDKKSTIVLYEINAKEVYCRWEGIHNGFLLVFETKRNIGENWKEFAEKYHSEIQKSLDVY